MKLSRLARIKKDHGGSLREREGNGLVDEDILKKTLLMKRKQMRVGLGEDTIEG